MRELALFNLGIDSKLRGCDLVALKVRDVCHGEQVFVSARAATDSDTDLRPYWLCEGPVKVERRVPIFPFSRETNHFDWLKRSLMVYRLAFGQPRQDNLLRYLSGLLDSHMTMNEIEALQIGLQP